MSISGDIYTDSVYVGDSETLGVDDMQFIGVEDPATSTSTTTSLVQIRQSNSVSNYSGIVVSI